MKNYILNHWIVQRLSAIILLPFLLSGLFIFSFGTSEILYDVYNLNSLFCLSELTFKFESFSNIGSFIILFIFLLLMKHMHEGIDSILQDYVHHDNTKVLAMTMLAIVQMFLIRYFAIFVLFL